MSVTNKNVRNRRGRSFTIQERLINYIEIELEPINKNSRKTRPYSILRFP